METHLNDEQIEDLLQADGAGDAESASKPRIDEDAQKHLKVCENCQARLRSEKKAMERLAILKTNTSGMSTPQCPSDEVWLEVAAGIETQDSESYLSHAASCDHCGPLLHQAVLDLTTELTPEEDSMISALPSSKPRGQRTLAAKLSDAGSSGIKSRIATQPRALWPAPFASYRRIVLTASVMVSIVLGVVWLRTHRAQSASPEQLIADAYKEKRTLEVRIEGAPYVPLRQERGSDIGQDRMSRRSLLTAEAAIAQQLSTHPDDVRWLQASGRASLLEDNTAGSEAAVATLEKANRLAPGDASVTVDLASAYLIRGEVMEQRADYGKAVDLLRGVLSSHRGGETAQYNLAVALGKISCKAGAAEAWRSFLAQYPRSPWAQDAQDHLSQVQREICERQRRSDSPLKTAEQVSAIFQGRDKDGVEEIDRRIEEYQDLAIQTWLPRSYSPGNVNSPSALHDGQALQGLSELLTERHHDPWLKDILKADRHSPEVTEAIRMLADSASKIETSDESLAQREASKALSLFKRDQVPAGAIRAQLVLILAQQYEHRDEPCESMARAMRRDSLLQRYPWILAQVLLEDSLCASVSDRHALQAAQSGLQLAHSHRYPILVLRATAAESGLYSALGDSNRAWSAALDCLRTFWEGTYPALRGYNALVAIDEINFPQNRWFLEAAILQEAMPLVEGDPRTTMVAVEETRLGHALMQTGDFEGAEKSYRQAELLLERSAPGLQRTSLGAEAELGFAKVDLLRNNLPASLDRLERIRPIISKLPDDLLLLDFYQTSGIVKLRSNRLAEAEADLDSAIELAENGLRKVDTESDRWKWSHQNEPVYRAMAELKLRSNPEEAFLGWEWFKGAPLRGQDGTAFPSRPGRIGLTAQREKALAFPGLSHDSALVSFVAFPAGYAVWVWDREGLRETWVPLNQSELSSLAIRFTEESSDPQSDLPTLHKDGAALYRKLVLPIEPWISADRRLVIEPDGALRMLPLGLLMAPDGEYLGDRYSITISPGIAYLNGSRKWTGISAASSAFVLGDPTAPGWSPLPDAEQEAQAVATSFAHPRLLMRDESPTSDLARSIAKADVFHFSGHAQASVESVGLVIGTLGTLDSAQLDAVSRGRTQLAVLSACSTSRGTSGLFDDDDSLVRRLMGARVPEVVASRWMVDSAATTLLMKSFYAGLLAGMPASEALDAAMRSVRTRPEFSHPYYWAGFSVFGRS